MDITYCCSNVGMTHSFLVLEGFDKLTERVNFKAHRKRSLHSVKEHSEHRATQKLSRAGGFAKSFLTMSSF